ncbi:MAG TPA: aspartyl protease family protein [Candidatus Obscuribacterales bacterium]
MLTRIDKYGSFKLALTLVLLLSALVFQVATAAAEQAKVELSIAELVQKSLTAYGGKEALAQLQAASTINGHQITERDGKRVERDYRVVRKGDKWRLDLEAGLGDRTAEPAKEKASLDSQAKAEKADSGSPVSAPEKVAAQGLSADTADGALSPAATQAKSPPGLEVTACDGRRAWRSTGGDVMDLSKEEFDAINQKLLRQPALMTLWQEPGVNFELVGRTQYKQIPVFAITVSSETLPQTTLYLDQKNYLVVAITYSVQEAAAAGAPSNKASAVALELSEYRPSAGTLFPFKQTAYIDGNLSCELEIASVALGQSVDDALFDRPRQEGKYRLAKSISMPFEYFQNEILVKGRINNSDELDFLFDTGASDTIIDRRIAAQNFLAKQGQSDIAGYAGLVAAQRSELKRMELGGLVLNDVPVRVLDLSPQSRQLGRHIAGIIGTNIISQFAVTIDYSKPALTFADPETFVRPAKAASVPFVFRQLPFVKVTINGKDEQILLVDTGAAFNHLPFKTAQRHIVGDPANVRHVTEGTGLDGRPIQMGKVTIDSLTIGGLPLRSVSFTYPIEKTAKATPSSPKTPSAERTGFFQSSSFGILGNPFWQNFNVIVDYRFQRLLLVPNPLVKLTNEIDSALSAGDAKLVVHRDYRQAEMLYMKALLLADSARDVKTRAKLLGRLGNLRRIMAKDLNRPEHAKAAYQYFVKAQELARNQGAREIEGRIIADWSLLYSDNGQAHEAKQTIDRALQLAPQDPNVNVDCAVHLYRAKLYPEMQKYIEKALFLEPSNWQALWYQVKLSEMFADTPRAVATLKDILRFYPWSKVASDKLKALSERITVTPAYPQAAPQAPNWMPSIPSVTPSPGTNVPRIIPWGRPGAVPPSVPMIVPSKKPSAAMPLTVPTIMPSKNAASTVEVRTPQ